MTIAVATIAATAAATAAAGCTVAAPAPHGLQVVAAEGVWGSIAAQIGGPRVHVTSIVSSPAADPHDYEPTAADARAVAVAQVVIVNGAGYDPWASKLLAADPVHGRVVLDVGDVVGVGAGGNPHRWYSPGDVRKVVAAITRGLGRVAPKDARSFERRRTRFETVGLARYHALIAGIRRTSRGVPVGASESIFAPLARALGLDLVTPPAFLKAIAEGAEPSARDTAAIDRQIARRQIAVWVENGQNRTPDVERLTRAARARGIPVVEITETPSPAGATFQAWQSRQLEELAAALARARGDGA